MSDAPAIRPHSPRQNRWALVGLALLAMGSFGKAVVQKAGTSLFGWSSPAQQVQDAALPRSAAAPPSAQVAVAEPQTAPRPAPAPAAEPPVIDVAPAEPQPTPAAASATVDAAAAAPEIRPDPPAEPAAPPY